ncbi:hypothetical protein BG58_17700 [Caballeronia jiangsuensis]|nr:hypothetical protein BG58_17700 [Caballeronia jiangsuensis]
MTTPGSVALGDVAAKASHLDIACSRCGRRGKYQLARLVARLGPDFPMTDLASQLTDCPNRGASSHAERCDVYFPGLVAILHGGTS